jgi:hypothetical protein
MEDDERALVSSSGDAVRSIERSGSPGREITVNGRRHVVESDSIDHSELVRLAFPDMRFEEARSVTVTYRGGPLRAAEGVLTTHQGKPVAQGETFVVARTVAS